MWQNHCQRFSHGTSVLYTLQGKWCTPPALWAVRVHHFPCSVYKTGCTTRKPLTIGNRLHVAVNKKQFNRRVTISRFLNWEHFDRNSQMIMKCIKILISNLVSDIWFSWWQFIWLLKWTNLAGSNYVTTHPLSSDSRMIMKWVKFPISYLVSDIWFSWC